MKYSVTTRRAALLAALLLTAGAVASCGETAQTPADNKDSAAVTDAVVTEAAVTEEPRILPDLPEADFGGYEFKILHWFMDGWESRACKDLVADAMNGDTLNDAVYQRNLAVSERYNVTFSMTQEDFAKICTTIKKFVTAGEDAYDLAYTRLYEGKALLTTGCYYNFNALPNIDLTKPWWDVRCKDCMEYDGKLYLMASDINIEDKNATAAILFNKTLASNYDVEDLYALVRDGKWTIDKMREIYSDVSSDVNGDGVMDAEDLWGFLGGNDVGVSFFLGGEGTYIQRDEKGNLIDTFNTEHNVALTEKIKTVMTDTVNFYNHHDGTQKAPVTDDNEYRDMFAGGHGLFFWSRLDEVTTLRTLETDFGILPTPKYDEAQKEYCSLVSQHITGLMTVPASISDPERTGIILEALAAESMYTVQPAYYEVALKGKYLRDDDSAEMLDLIFANRMYDFGEIFDLGGWASQHNIVCKSTSQGVASNYEKYQSKIDKALIKLVDSLEALE